MPLQDERDSVSLMIYILQARCPDKSLKCETLYEVEFDQAFRARIVLKNTVTSKEGEMVMPYSNEYPTKKEAKKAAAKICIDYLRKYNLYPHDSSRLKDYSSDIESSTKDNFECDYCFKIFNNSVKLMQHCYSSHSSNFEDIGNAKTVKSSEFSCLFCRNIFQTAMQRNHHQIMSHKYTDYFKNVNYLAIIDFEATCEEGYELQNPEIIEFGITLLDLKSNLIIDKINYYIKPLINPKLSEYCINLTGITQDIVDNGYEWKYVYQKIDKWIKSRTNNKLFIIVTDGRYDLEYFLPIQMNQHKNLPIYDYYKKYIDVKTIFCTFNLFKKLYKNELKLYKYNGYLNINRPAYMKKIYRYINPNGGCNIEFMLKIFKLDRVGKFHSGLDDSLNLARICQKLNEKNIRFEGFVVDVNYDKTKKIIEMYDMIKRENYS